MGALEGSRIGHYTYEVKATYKETLQRYDDQAPAGTIVKIEDVSALPTHVGAGDKVELGATYALLGTSPDADITVTETREIRYEGNVVGRPKVTLTHKGGTYSSTVPLFLPNDAKTGTYEIIITIQTPNARDSSRTHFTVTEKFTYAGHQTQIFG